LENTKRAVIYTRGENDVEQKLLCYFYASDNDIDVLFDTKDIDEVADCEECNMMLVTNASRISRDTFKYHQIVKALKVRGIEVVFTSTAENSERLIDLLMKDLYKKKVK
jgi:hypothetical protein